MICLLGGKTGSDGSSCTNNAWRPYLDLEYNECYSVTNKWNALFNGEMKYIFNAYFPNGQCVGQLCHALGNREHLLEDADAFLRAHLSSTGGSTTASVTSRCGGLLLSLPADVRSADDVVAYLKAIPCRTNCST